MPFIATKCNQCGGIINAESAQKTLICEFCGTPFVIEQTGVTGDSLINYADILLRDGYFEKANGIYDRALELSPHDHRAHRGKFFATLHISDDSDGSIKALVESKYKANPNISDEEDVINFTSVLCRPHFNNALLYAPDKAKQIYLSWRDRLIKFALEKHKIAHCNMEEMLNKANERSKRIASETKPYQDGILALNNLINQNEINIKIAFDNFSKREKEAGKNSFMMIALGIIGGIVMIFLARFISDPRDETFMPFLAVAFIGFIIFIIAIIINNKMNAKKVANAKKKADTFIAERARLQLEKQRLEAIISGIRNS